MYKLLKKTLFFISILFAVLILFNLETASYFLMQAKGGLNVAFNTQAISEIINDKTQPDSLRKRLKYIEVIKKFGIDSLGLNNIQRNYSTFFNQNGKPLVYVLVVADAFKLKTKTFDFPIIGSFQYKGFFEKEAALKEELKFKKMGFDTKISEASAYSTLGYLPEPILSSMLWRSDASLSDLIFHEMTHSTVFVKNDHELSENLANFVGNYGANRFIIYKFGTNSLAYRQFVSRKKFGQSYQVFMNRASKSLDSLYVNFPQNITFEEKKRQKTKLFALIMASQDTLMASFPLLKFKLFDPKSPPNNADFAGYLTYHAQQNKMDSIYKYQFDSNFPRFLNYWKKKYE